MAVIHIFKDGTKTTELKEVYAPKELVENVAKILERREGRNEKKKNASNN